MGDLFFVLKMSVFTVVIVLLMQIKVGSQTLEQRFIDITHQSQVAGMIQGVSQNAATFLGDQYNNITGLVGDKFPKFPKNNLQPRERLKTKIQEIKDSINSEWESENKTHEIQD